MNGNKYKVNTFTCRFIATRLLSGSLTSTLTQCFLSTSSSASHFLVRNGYFLLIISPSKNVVKVGNSSVKPLIFRYPHKYEFSSSTCWNHKVNMKVLGKLSKDTELINPIHRHVIINWKEHSVLERDQDCNHTLNLMSAYYAFGIITQLQYIDSSRRKNVYIPQEEFTRWNSSIIFFIQYLRDSTNLPVSQAEF